ncbi:MAG: transglycosylase SLT domain-containing protein, partial [Nanoarchaeota archaeon]|nr:transglycosylase SLT domain-containing protein [Nanoarchaeota archaeon]
ECGFKSVTTDFGLNYVKDQYIKEQVETTNIKTENECISGTKSAYSLINSNVQSGIENALNPKISNYNIIRICATSSPGQGSDEFWNVPEKARWRQVGYCDSENMGCWLDTDSLEDAFNWDATLDESLVDVNNYYLSVFENKTLTAEQFKALIDDINSYTKTKEGFEEAIKKIDKALSSEVIFYDFQKAHLYFLKGNFYSLLAKNLYNSQNRPVRDLGESSSPLTNDLEAEDFGFGATEVSAIKFELGNDLRYSYWGRAWHFYVDGWDKWYESSEEGANLYEKEVAEYIYKKAGIGLNTIPFLEFTSEQKNLLIGLENQNLFKGVELLLGQVVFGNFEEINVGNIKFDRDVVFSNVPFYGENALFKFESGKWKWTIDSKNWYDVSQTNNLLFEQEVSKSMAREFGSVAKSNLPYTLNSNQKVLLGKLVNAGFGEGAAEIFNLASTAIEGAGISNINDAFKDKVGDIEDFLEDLEGEVKCSDCGKGFSDVCTKEQCEAINMKYPDLNCVYEEKWWKIGGTCVDKDLEYVDRGEIDYNMKSRSMSDVLSAISQSTIVSDSCANYARVIVEAAQKYSTKNYVIDPLLLVAIMQQESHCGNLSDTYTASCPGVMQICFYEICNSLNIPNKDYFRSPNTVNKNIGCGTEILAKYYEQYSKNGAEFKGCNKNVIYYGWEAAIRAYNGLGCNPKYPKQDDYVENVVNIYQNLRSFVDGGN